MFSEHSLHYVAHFRWIVTVILDVLVAVIVNTIVVIIIVSVIIVITVVGS